MVIARGGYRLGRASARSEIDHVGDRPVRNLIVVIVQISDPSGLIELGSGPVQGSFGSVQGYIFQCFSRFSGPVQASSGQCFFKVFQGFFQGFSRFYKVFLRFSMFRSMFFQCFFNVLWAFLVPKP